MKHNSLTNPVYEHLKATGGLEHIVHLGVEKMNELLAMGFECSDFGWFQNSPHYTGEKYEACETLEQCLAVLTNQTPKAA